MNKKQIYIFLHRWSLYRQFANHSNVDPLKKTTAIMAIILNVWVCFSKTNSTILVIDLQYAFFLFSMQKICNEPSMLSLIKRITLTENE